MIIKSVKVLENKITLEFFENLNTVSVSNKETESLLYLNNLEMIIKKISGLQEPDDHSTIYVDDSNVLSNDEYVDNLNKLKQVIDTLSSEGSDSFGPEVTD